VKHASWYLHTAMHETRAELRCVYDFFFYLVVADIRLFLYPYILGINSVCTTTELVLSLVMIYLCSCEIFIRSLEYINRYLMHFARDRFR
jgi:hypothetical protein